VTRLSNPEEIGMKCIKREVQLRDARSDALRPSERGRIVRRVTEAQARELVRKGWQYCSKQEWKQARRGT